MEIIGQHTKTQFFLRFKLLFGGRLSDFCHDGRLAVSVISDTEIVSQFHSGFFARQFKQSGNKVNGIPIRTAAETMKTLIHFHARCAVIVKRTGNRRFVPVMVYPERAEVHILDDEAASRAYINQMWAEAMAIYRSGDFKLRFSPTMNEYLKAHQREFMPEDTKAGQILDYLDSYKGNAVCSKQLYREALGHEYDEPKQWELREINDIMNNVVKGWKSFSNPRHFPKPYLRQKGWERELPDNGEADNGDGKFIPLSDAELKQMELPEGWR